MRMILFGAIVCLAACDTEAPMIVDFTPTDNADLRGVGHVTIDLTASDASGTAIADLAIDGELRERVTSHACASQCLFSWDWDTRTLPAGEHVLDLRLEDGNGNHETASHAVVLDDVVTVTRLGVHGIVDDVGTLEIEVYVFDDTTNALLGCAGSRNGLGPVDASDIVYPVDGEMIDVANRRLAARELAAHPIRFEVWEDDDPPVCPVSPDPLGNDLVGKSAPATLDRWRAAVGDVAFDGVTNFALKLDRPLDF